MKYYCIKESYEGFITDICFVIKHRISPVNA